MKSWTLLVALAVAVSAAAADNKDKDKKKEPAAQQPAAPVPNEGELALQQGRTLEGKGELDAAIDAYTAAAAKLTGAPRAEALGRMAVAQELRAMPQAAATAAEATAADAGAAWANIALSRTRAREGKGDEALALAQKAEAAGGGAAAVTALGCAQEAQGDLAAAEASYRRAQADESQRIAAGLGLVRVLRKTYRAAEAEPLVKAILEQAPGVVEAYKESARVKVALGRASEAMGDAATASALAENDPDTPRLQQELAVGRAVELIAVNRLDEALAELKKVVDADPSAAEAQFRMGYIHHVRKRDAAAALPYLEKAVAAAPGNAEYRTQLGAALLDLKQFDRAAGELARATSGAGEKRADAWTYLGAAQLGAKKYKDAVAALDKAAALSADNAQVEAYLAWSYFGLKDSKAFVAHAARAKALGHKEPTLLEYLGRVEKGEPIK
jgi:tetratricopeptide (TPR) repeat protein